MTQEQDIVERLLDAGTHKPIERELGTWLTSLCQEAAQTIAALRVKYDDLTKLEFMTHKRAETAEARIKELEAEISNLDAELDHWSRLAVDDLGKNPPTSWKEIAEALRAERDKTKAELERRTANPADHRYWEGRWRDTQAELEAAEAKVKELEGDLHHARESWGYHDHRANTAIRERDDARKALEEIDEICEPHTADSNIARLVHDIARDASSNREGGE